MKHAMRSASKKKSVRRRRHTPPGRHSCTAVLEMPLVRDHAGFEQAVLKALLDTEYADDTDTAIEHDDRKTDAFIDIVQEDEANSGDNVDDSASLTSSSTSSSWSPSAFSSCSGVDITGARGRRFRSMTIMLPCAALDYWSYLDGIHATRRAIRARIVDDLDANVEEGLREVPGLRGDDALRAVYARHRARYHGGGDGGPEPRPQLRCAVGTRYDWFKRHMPLVAGHVAAIARHIELKAAAVMEETEDEPSDLESVDIVDDLDYDGCDDVSGGHPSADHFCSDVGDDTSTDNDGPYVIRVTDSKLSAAERRRYWDSSCSQFLALQRATEQIARLGIDPDGSTLSTWQS